MVDLQVDRLYRLFYLFRVLPICKLTADSFIAKMKNTLESSDSVDLVRLGAELCTGSWYKSLTGFAFTIMLCFFIANIIILNQELYRARRDYQEMSVKKETLESKERGDDSEGIPDRPENESW